MSTRQAEWIKITDRLASQVETPKEGRGGHQPGGVSTDKLSQVATVSKGGQQLDAYRPLIISVRRAVAIAKLTEFENQAFRLGDYVTNELMPRPVAGDALYDVALANDLLKIHGDDVIQGIIAAGLGGAHE